VGIAVHDEDALGGGIVKDGVCVLIGFGLAGDLEVCRSKMMTFALAAVGDEASPNSVATATP